MKNQELFDKTISILVNAYQKDLLEHGDCTKCAVGNLICANMFNGDYSSWDSHWSNNTTTGLKNNWNQLFTTNSAQGEQEINKYNEFDENIISQIESTGYKWVDLAKIEFAFEICAVGETDEEYMFNGLMSVVDTLMLIHEATPQEAKSAKELFTLADVG